MSRSVKRARTTWYSAMPASPLFQATLDLLPGNTGFILPGLSNNNIIYILPEMSMSAQVNEHTCFLPLNIGDKLNPLYTHAVLSFLALLYPSSEGGIIPFQVPPAGLELAANGLGKRPASNGSGKAVLSIIALLRPGTRRHRRVGHPSALSFLRRRNNPFSSAPGRS